VRIGVAASVEAFAAGHRLRGNHLAKGPDLLAEGELPTETQRSGVCTNRAVAVVGEDRVIEVRVRRFARDVGGIRAKRRHCRRLVRVIDSQRDHAAQVGRVRRRSDEAERPFGRARRLDFFHHLDHVISALVGFQDRDAHCVAKGIVGERFECSGIAADAGAVREFVHDHEQLQLLVEEWQRWRDVVVERDDEILAVVDSGAGLGERRVFARLREQELVESRSRREWRLGEFTRPNVGGRLRGLSREHHPTHLDCRRQ